MYKKKKKQINVNLYVLKKLKFIKNLQRKLQKNTKNTVYIFRTHSGS